MIVNVDKDYEKFLSEILIELSKESKTDIKCYMFASIIGEDVFTAFNDCSCLDKALFATHLQMQANYEYTVFNISGNQNEESED